MKHSMLLYRMQSAIETLDVTRSRLDRLGRELAACRDDLPQEFAQFGAASAVCGEHLESLLQRLNALGDALPAAMAGRWRGSDPLTDADIGQLLALNRRLRDLTGFLAALSASLVPRMEESMRRDSPDSFLDYDITAHLIYILRDDDPDYDHDDDNILTIRKESLKKFSRHVLDDFTEPVGPVALRAEPHCWLFHDLYDHGYGLESPRLSFHDCLRVGAIWVDIEVRTSYVFPPPAGGNTGDGAD
jgi:hypothetical protein